MNIDKRPSTRSFLLATFGSLLLCVSCLVQADAVADAKAATEAANAAAAAALEAANAATDGGAAVEAAMSAAQAAQAAADAAMKALESAQESAQTETPEAAPAKPAAAAAAPASSGGTGYAEHVQCETKPCKIDLYLTRGFRAFSQCQVCHGLDGNGSTIGPSLVEKLKEVDKAQFVDVVTNGKTGQIGVMPGWANNPNVMKYMDNLYDYLMARSDGVIPAGKLARYDR